MISTLVSKIWGLRVPTRTHRHNDPIPPRGYISINLTNTNGLIKHYDVNNESNCHYPRKVYSNWRFIIRMPTGRSLGLNFSCPLSKVELIQKADREISAKDISFSKFMMGLIEEHFNKNKQEIKYETNSAYWLDAVKSIDLSNIDKDLDNLSIEEIAHIQAISRTIDKKCKDLTYKKRCPIKKPLPTTVTID